MSNQKRLHLLPDSTGKEKKDPSQNALKHGCRSTTIRFIAGESKAEFDALSQAWIDQYHPTSRAEFEMIRLIIDANWRMRRTERAFSDYEASLFAAESNPALWTDDQARRLQLMQRYKTTETNNFHKARREFESMFKTELQRRKMLENYLDRRIKIAALPKEERDYRNAVIRAVGDSPKVPQRPANDALNTDSCDCPLCDRAWGIEQMALNKNTQED
jgi:hypothetical protein